MKDINIVFEIKKLNVTIGRYLFKLHNKNNINIPPSPLQMEIIGVLVKCSDTVFIKDIQEKVGVSKAAISDAIDKMMKKGLIEKRGCKEDLRKTEVILLDKGRELFNELNENVEIINKEILKNVSLEELEEFLRISHKIEKNIRKEDEIC